MLLSCAVYISSGASSIASRVAAVASAAHHRATVVDTFTDAAYARSSIKIVGQAQPLLCAARAAAAEALALLDLSQEPHPAPHPRQGAVDMVSFMPLSEARACSLTAEIDACDRIAWQLGDALGALGCPILMYGPRADRSLLETRRGTSFFASCKAGSPREASASLPFDFGHQPEDGSVPQRSGVSIVGVQPYVTNFNIQIEDASLADCKVAAAALRTAMGVQVMALPHAEGCIEIGCNLQATQDRDSPCCDAVLSFVTDRLPNQSRVRHSYVIGLTPNEALTMAQGLQGVPAGPVHE